MPPATEAIAASMRASTTRERRLSAAPVRGIEVGCSDVLPLMPAASATLLAGALATMLARRGQARARPAVLIGAWVALLAAAFAVAGRTGLGTLLTSAFVVQVIPSVWTAYRTARPTGISRGTWLLIFGELSCWTIFGVHKSDPRLMILGLTGVAASLLMLARIRRTTKIQPSTETKQPESASQ